jgi:hypothetical protein
MGKRGPKAGNPANVRSVNIATPFTPDEAEFTQLISDELGFPTRVAFFREAIAAYCLKHPDALKRVQKKRDLKRLTEENKPGIRELSTLC